MTRGTARKKSDLRHQPYKSSSGASQKPRVEPSEVAASATSVSPPFPRFPRNTKITVRQHCQKMIGYLNPGIEPRNDWELLQLGVKRYQGGQAEVYAALDKEFKLMSEDEDLMETQEDWDCALNTVFEPTGIKPYPGEEDECIQIRPIPDTKYSIRLFPGSFTDAEYCMDFVDNETGEAVNSPFPFELFAGGGETDTPWLNFQGSMKVASIERIFGHKQGEILPGEEKFILRDGQMCVLTRPGKPKIRFTVPIRVHPENRPVEETDVIHLDFPKKITLAP